MITLTPMDPKVQILTHLTNAYTEQARLVRRIVNYSGTEYRPSHILFDAGDYATDPNVLDEFRDIAFYWNRDRPKDRVPAHVRDLMDDESCSHLIWLSRRALDEENILFVWIVAHELRHLYQATHTFSRETLRKSASELRRRLEFRNLPSGPLSVAELDCDLFAMRVAKNLFGVNLVATFLAQKVLPRCPFQSYARFLKSLEQATTGSAADRHDAD